MTSTHLVQTGPLPTAQVAPLDKTALKLQLARLEDPEMLQLQNRLAAAYDAACAALIGPNDVQVEGNRSFKKKSAWQKLGRHFAISTEIIRETLEYIGEGEDREFIAKCVVRGTSTWGQVGDAAGACGSDEESGRRTITMADAIATAQTRATNRAISNLIAMGEVSAEELAKGKAKPDAQRAATEPELLLEEAELLVFPWPQNKKYGGKPLAEVSTRMLLTVSRWAKAKLDAGDAGRSIEKLYRACVLITEQRPDLEAAIAAQQASVEKDDAEQAAAATSIADGVVHAGDTALQLVKDGPVPVADGQAFAPGDDHSAGPTTPATPTPTATAAPAASSSTTAPNGSSAKPDAGPLVPELEEAPASPAGSQELTQQLIALIDSPRTTEDLKVKYLERAAAGKLRTDTELRRAIGELTLAHEIGG